MERVDTSYSIQQREGSSLSTAEIHRKLKPAQHILQGNAAEQLPVKKSLNPINLEFMGKKN